MRALTTSFTESISSLAYAPHRLQTTGTSLLPAPTADRPAQVGRRDLTPQLFVDEIDFIATLPVEGIGVLFQGDIAALYREFALEDRQLAEAGLEDYRRLLAQADEE